MRSSFEKTRNTASIPAFFLNQITLICWQSALLKEEVILLQSLNDIITKDISSIDIFCHNYIEVRVHALGTFRLPDFLVAADSTRRMESSTSSRCLPTSKAKKRITR